VFLDGQLSILEKAKRRNSKISNLFIDIGCETKKVDKMGVHVGCVITYPDEFMILNDNKFVCRAIDNRWVVL
jgi:putative aminopeptidase FrvX